MPQTHKIRRAIILPWAAALFFLFALLLLAWSKPTLPGERVLLTVVFITMGCFFLEVASRRVSLRKEGLEIGKLLRKKELRWDEITHLGSVIMGAKVYILLTTTRGFYILSNNYERFVELLQTLCFNLGSERVDREIVDLTKHPRQNYRPVLSVWLMAAVIITVFILRLFIV